jgi:hypothetical protein
MGSVHRLRALFIDTSYNCVTVTAISLSGEGKCAEPNLSHALQATALDDLVSSNGSTLHVLFRLVSCNYMSRETRRYAKMHASCDMDLDISHVQVGCSPVVHMADAMPSTTNLSSQDCISQDGIFTNTKA